MKQWQQICCHASCAAVFSGFHAFFSLLKEMQTGSCNTWRLMHEESRTGCNLQCNFSCFEMSQRHHFLFGYKWQMEKWVETQRRLELIPTIMKLQNFGVLCIIASCRGEGVVQILAHWTLKITFWCQRSQHTRIRH